MKCYCDNSLSLTLANIGTQPYNHKLIYDERHQSDQQCFYKNKENVDCNLLTTLNFENVEHIFSFLSCNDLATVSKTSRLLRSYVQKYAFHLVVSDKRIAKVWEFFDGKLLHKVEKD